MRTPFALSLPLLCLALFMLGGCRSDSPTSYSSSPSSTVTAQPNTVTMANSAFNPASMTISRNTTITWRNNDGMLHTSSSDTGVWDTGDMGQGGTKTTTFSSAGTFTYHCTHHPSMLGTIIVQ